MTGYHGHNTARRFFTSGNATSYDAVVKYATFNQDLKWKQQISVKSSKYCAILDLACGTGILSAMLNKNKLTVSAGLDLTREYLKAYSSKVSVPAAQGTAEWLPFRENSFDAVVSSYLAKYVDIARVVSESQRVLRLGGLLIFHDFSVPSSQLFRALWRMHFVLLQSAGYVVQSWQTVFRELERVIEESHWEEKTLAALRSSGFTDIDIQTMTLGTSCIISGRKS